MDDHKIMLQTNEATNIVKVIIAHQQSIIGPLAFEQARKVPGLKVGIGNQVEVIAKSEESAAVLSKLVQKYEELFGLASIEACKDAIKEIKPPIKTEDLPEVLR